MEPPDIDPGFDFHDFGFRGKATETEIKNITCRKNYTPFKKSSMGSEIKPFTNYYIETVKTINSLGEVIKDVSYTYSEEDMIVKKLTGK